MFIFSPEDLISNNFDSMFFSHQLTQAKCTLFLLFALGKQEEINKVFLFWF